MAAGTDLTKALPALFNKFVWATHYGWQAEFQV